MFWGGKSLPGPVRRKLEQIKGKTLWHSSRTGHYLDRVTNEDYGRHEIDWMLSHGIMTKTFNIAKFVYEFKLNPYYD